MGAKCQNYCHAVQTSRKWPGMQYVHSHIHVCTKTGFHFIASYHIATLYNYPCPMSQLACVNGFNFLDVILLTVENHE